VGEYLTEQLPRLELISRMIGKEPEVLEAQSSTAATAATVGRREPLLRAAGLGRKGAIEPFDLELYPGEVLGLAGLLGSGRTELARLLFGADKADQGEVELAGGSTQQLHSPRQAIDAKIAFCPENRKTEAVIEDLTVRENIILAMQASLGTFRYLPRRKQTELADEYIRLLNIKTPGTEALIRDLSGGNQQKVILGRWLLTRPELLILDEPTRGIDVGAKAEIQKQMARLCGQGMSIVFISSELEEVLRSSRRIVVLRDRRKVAELANRDLTQQDIMTAIAGGDAG
jgi:simple sugar transport system ATP-binding protein